MLGILITGGEGPEPEALKKIAQGADILAAADSGLIAAERAGLRPDWIVGDMDSLGTVGSQDGLAMLDKYPAGRVIRYPPEKDFTDTELALRLLREKGCDVIRIAGGGGGRMDHLFAIRSLFERENPPQSWFTANEEIHCLEEGAAFGGGCRALSCGIIPFISVFPLGAGPWEAESSGLKWPLAGLSWDRGAFGVSNVITESPFEIRSARGRFMVIIVKVHKR